MTPVISFVTKGHAPRWQAGLTDKTSGRNSAKMFESVPALMVLVRKKTHGKWFGRRSNEAIILCEALRHYRASLTSLQGNLTSLQQSITSLQRSITSPQSTFRSFAHGRKCSNLLRCLPASLAKSWPDPWLAGLCSTGRSSADWAETVKQNKETNIKTMHFGPELPLREIPRFAILKLWMIKIVQVKYNYFASVMKDW